VFYSKCFGQVLVPTGLVWVGAVQKISMTVFFRVYIETFSIFKIYILCFYVTSISSIYHKYKYMNMSQVYHQYITSI